MCLNPMLHLNQQTLSVNGNNKLKSTKAKIEYQLTIKTQIKL